MAALVAALLAVPAVAHHSFSMFDFKKSVTISGMVTEFQWTNPHVYLEIDATNAAGVVTHYSIESASPSLLLKKGWKFSSVRREDKVTLLFFPLRNGGPGGFLSTVTFADGRKLDADYGLGGDGLLGGTP
jgi:hypothetical protein